MIPNFYMNNGCFTKHPVKKCCFRFQVGICFTQRLDLIFSIPLMKELLHHLGCIKPSRYINNGITYLSTGAGFLPSTVLVLLSRKLQGFFRQNFLINPYHTPIFTYTHGHQYRPWNLSIQKGKSSKHYSEGAMLAASHFHFPKSYAPWKWISQFAP